jgi:hypothetical protein
MFQLNLAKKPVSRLATLAAFACVSFSLLAPQTVHAGWVNYPPHHCKPASQTTKFQTTFGSIYGNDTVAKTSFFCPVLGTDTYPLDDVVSVNVYVDDFHTSGLVRAAACALLVDGLGGACGAPVKTSSSGTGWAELKVDPTPFHDYPLEYAWLSLQLPPKVGTLPTSGSVLVHGYSLEF